MARRSNPAERLQSALAGLHSSVDLLEDIAVDLEHIAADLERNNDDDIASGNVWPECPGCPACQPVGDVDYQPADTDV